MVFVVCQNLVTVAFLNAQTNPVSLRMCHLKVGVEWLAVATYKPLLRPSDHVNFEFPGVQRMWFEHFFRKI